MSVARGLRWLVVLALMLCVAPSSGHAETPPPDPSRERPSTVVVSVSDDGFHGPMPVWEQPQRSPRRCSRSASCWPCDRIVEETGTHEALSERRRRLQVHATKEDRSGRARLALGSALLVVVVLIPTMAYARQDELAGVRQVTAQFHRVDAAKEAGYELGYVNGLGNRIITGCIAHPTAGAMGYHYFNKALIDDMVVDPLKPEGLVYAPAANGSSSSCPWNTSSRVLAPTRPGHQGRRRPCSDGRW